MLQCLVYHLTDDTRAGNTRVLRAEQENVAEEGGFAVSAPQLMLHAH